ncbi:MAG: class I SAM-dependent methyltransferase [Candidatus Aenigmarchaeota archaeon]|nr:class I SAM-dependent methyltransferase [Candidatus Aenigmarchaeota archaeon]
MGKSLPHSTADYWSNNVWDGRLQETINARGDYRKKQRTRTVNYVNGLSCDRDEIAVTELCCGTGRVVEGLISSDGCGDKIRSIDAIDISSEALVIARQKINDSRVRFHNQSVYDFDYQPASADVVICIEALFHLPDLGRTYQTIHEHLKPDGVFIGNFTLREGLDDWLKSGIGLREYYTFLMLYHMRKLARLIPPLWDYLGSSGIARTELYTEEEIREELGEHGFEIEDFDNEYDFWFAARKT